MPFSSSLVPRNLLADLDSDSKSIVPFWDLRSDSPPPLPRYAGHAPLIDRALGSHRGAAAAALSSEQVASSGPPSLPYRAAPACKAVSHKLLSSSPRHLRTHRRTRAVVSRIRIALSLSLQVRPFLDPPTPHGKVQINLIFVHKFLEASLYLSLQSPTPTALVS
jgi:hypothetical protein